MKRWDLRTAFNRAKKRLDKYSMPEPNSGCVLWIGAIMKNGYGVSSFDSKSVLAHRLAYQIHIGSIPEGLQIDHTCRVRCCVNPYHLEPVTCAENLRRGVGQLPHELCRRGHPLTPENLKWKSNGKRHCKICDQSRRGRHAYA